MLESYPFTILLGIILGFLSGLGTGGGSLLILWLTAVIGMGQASARVINLLFFLPCAFASSCLRIRRGLPPLSTIRPGILWGAVTAAIFTLIGRGMDTGLLRKLFGILLLFTGFRELFYRPQNAR